MFEWLFEGRTSVYVVLVALAGFLLLVWWQTRKRWLLGGVVLAVGLAALYALLDKSVESDREQIVRKIQQMANAVNARDMEGLSRNISDNFRSPQGKDKQQFQDTIAGYLRNGVVTNARVWDIEFPAAPSREHSPAQVFFRAKAESGGRELLADCDATFDYSPSEGWRLRTLRLLKPQMTEEWQIQL